MAAIREYGRYQPEQAFQSMSPVTRLAVKRMGWIELCMSEDQSIDRAHFLKIYQAEENRQKENALLPLDMFEKLEQKQLEYQQQRQQTEQKLLEQKKNRKHFYNKNFWRHSCHRKNKRILSVWKNC